MLDYPEALTKKAWEKRVHREIEKFIREEAEKKKKGDYTCLKPSKTLLPKEPG